MGYRYIANTENEQKLFKNFEDLKNQTKVSDTFDLEDQETLWIEKQEK